MPEAARQTDDGGVHDGSWGPSPHPIIGGSEDVFINGTGAARVDDEVTTHKKGDTNHKYVTISAGSGTVFINGKAAARKGDSLSCESTIDTGSSNVFIGG